MKKGLIFILAGLLIIGILYVKRESRPQKKAEQSPRAAVVIDDLGYNLENLDLIFKLDVPITLSILPNLAYSERIALEAGRRNYQTILHLPLGPHQEGSPIEKDTIFCNMTEEEVLERLDKAMSSVPDIAGLSNHMGSKATEDERLMGIIFDRMKRLDLFFQDNLVSPGSVCQRLAVEKGVRFVHRSVFLDNESDPEYIKGQIQQLADKALRTRWAVGVGHDRTQTLQVLKEMIPELKKKGIKFVFLSELAK